MQGTIGEQLGDMIKKKRQSMGLSTKKAAASANMSSTTLYMIESDSSKSQFGSIAKIAKALDFSIDEIIFKDKPMIDLRNKMELKELREKLANVRHFLRHDVLPHVNKGTLRQEIMEKIECLSR